jgi:hypothetical protein
MTSCIEAPVRLWSFAQPGEILPPHPLGRRALSRPALTTLCNIKLHRLLHAAMRCQLLRLGTCRRTGLLATLVIHRPHRCSCVGASTSSWIAVFMLVGWIEEENEGYGKSLASHERTTMSPQNGFCWESLDETFEVLVEYSPD